MLCVLRQDEVKAMIWGSAQEISTVDTTSCRGGRPEGRQHVPMSPSAMRVKSGKQQVAGTVKGVDGLAFQRRAIQQGTGRCTQLPREKVAQRQYARRHVTFSPTRSPAPAQVILGSIDQVRPIYFHEEKKNRQRDRKLDTLEEGETLIKQTNITRNSKGGNAHV